MATPWTKFRNLCSYYIDCVKYSEKRQEYLFTDQQDTEFLIPDLPVDWHLKSELEINTTKKQRVARAILLSADQSDEIFIGYPLSSFISPKGFHCLCPVMLFPVHLSTLGEGRTSGLRLEIDRQGIDINRDWVEFHIPREQQNYFIRACERTSDEMGSVDVDTALQFISNRCGGGVEPNLLDFTLRHSESRKGILNTAVLFIGGKTQYTRTLIKELNQIKNEPDAVLDSTALAYVFRDPVLPITSQDDENKVMPAVFTGQPLNAHQYIAVEESLNSPVVKVTGPPGTGKSHMSVNLIANEVFNGGSVLFTSKNHKAVHAVFDMCQACEPHPGFDLVEFCTAPGNDSACQWDKMTERLEAVKDLVSARMSLKTVDGTPLPDEIAFTSLHKVNELLSKFRDTEKDVFRYEELRNRIAEYERLLLEIDALLSVVPEKSRNSSDFLIVLEKVLEALEHEPRLGATSRLIRCLKTILGVAKPLPSAKEMLNELIPGIAPAYACKASVSKICRRLLKTLKYKSVIEAWRLSALDAVNFEASQCDYETLKNDLKNASSGIAEAIKDAYVDAACQRIFDVDVENLISRIQGELEANRGMPLPFLSNVADASRYERSLSLFEEFHKVFPAWAVTLLSLRKASPCLPGVFSLVLIDEASQCEIPPMIPALFRAKRLAVVGDPDQFPPVITIKQARNDVLRKKYGLLTSEMNKFSYVGNNVFSVVPRNKEQTIRLVEHFRCVDEIAMYCNSEFYNGGLCPCVGDRSDEGYSFYHIKPGMDWVNAPGGDAEEIQAALEYLRQLKKNDFKGSVGVISPLRKIADSMKSLCFEHRSELPDGLTDERINTANGFQGGQCDVVVFLLGLNCDRTPGRDGWYITADENKYIYNVSVSRARVCFTTFGDRAEALKSGISRIIKLMPDQRPPAQVKVGPGEEVLKKALEASGLSPVAQYPVCGRYLDLALVNEKIDVEVDGQAWHLDRNGCTKASDIHRDLLLESQGWLVVRVWHHEVCNDIEFCVQKVIDAVNSRRVGRQ